MIIAWSASLASLVGSKSSRDSSSAEPSSSIRQSKSLRTRYGPSNNDESKTNEATNSTRAKTFSVIQSRDTEQDTMSPVGTVPGRGMMRRETSQGDRPRPQSIMQIQPQQYQEADTRDILPELQPVLGFLNAHSQRVYNEGYFMKLADLRPGESAQFPWRFYIVCARAKGAEDSE